MKTLPERLTDAIADGPEDERIKGFAGFLVKALIENAFHMQDHELAFIADGVAMSLRMGTLSPSAVADISAALKSVGLERNNG